MKKVIQVLVGIFCVALIILLVQNWTTVNLNFLVFELSAPLGALIPVVFLGGVLVGWLVAGVRTFLKERRHPYSAPMQAALPVTAQEPEGENH